MPSFKTISVTTSNVSPGAERTFEGVVDVLGERSVYFEGENGEKVVYRSVPVALEGELIQKKLELVESLSNVDEEIGEMWVDLLLCLSW